MAKIGSKFVNKSSNHFQDGAGDALEIKLKTGGGIAADAQGLYVDATIAGDLIFKGNLDASALGSQLNNAKSGWFWKVSVAGTLLGIALDVGDNLYCVADVTGTPVSGASFSKIDNTEDAANVKNAGTSTAKTMPRFADATGKNIEGTNIGIGDDGSINLPSGAQFKVNGTKISAANVTGTTLKHDMLALGGTEIAAKYIDCLAPAYDLNAVQVFAGGVIQNLNADYTVTNGGAGGVLRINWSGKALDGLLASGDVLNVIYTTA